MQLNLAFIDPPNQPQPSTTDPAAMLASSPTIVPWEKLEPEAQARGLQILTRLIAAMLATASAQEADHE